MKKLFLFLFVISFNILVYGQPITVIEVSPAQDIIGAAVNSGIFVKLNKPVDSLVYTNNQLFKVYGTSTGLINGSVEKDLVNNGFTFSPVNAYHAGEIINVCFGPLTTNNNDTLKSFNWQFSTGITNPTNAKFDSLKRFNFPTGNPWGLTNSLTIDYDHDGYIDIVSGYYGLVLFNNGMGEFLRSENIPELGGLKYYRDVNNDNIVDLIIDNENTYEAKVLLGNNNGGYIFNQKLYPYINTDGRLLAEGDINGDGYTDLIALEFVGEEQYLIRKLINNGLGGFIRDTNSIDIKDKTIGSKLIDMDKDGDLDFVFSKQRGIECDAAVIYYNNGKGDFDTLKLFPFSIYSQGLADVRQLFVMDYDNNGLNDFAGFSWQSSGMLLLRDSIETFTAHGFSSAETSGLFTSGDTDGDNRFDIIISNFQTCVECGNLGDVEFAVIKNYPDSIIGYYSSFGEYFYLGKRYEVGGFIDPLLADVDNDGDLDIIHCSYPTTVTYNHTHIVDVEEEMDVPIDFSLLQNYPNPFNGATNIEYYLPKADNVKIYVYNILGEQIKVLVNNYQPAGKHNITFTPLNIGSGLYFYKIEYATLTKTNKMIYLK
ncbi:MAG: T9SS type A sorting domain-containing protein [bacterium]